MSASVPAAEPQTEGLLILNAGSSSLKFALYPLAEAAALIRGKIAGIGSTPQFRAEDAGGRALDPGALAQIAPDAGLAALIKGLLDWIAAHHAGITLRGIGHRVVHGGQTHTGPALVTPAVLADLTALVPLAPLHQPFSLACIRACTAWAADLPQVACFDTSFHRSQPRLHQIFALPRQLTEEGILRYGFHGLSYDYIAGELPAHLGARAEGRVVVAHLGNGASACALLGRRSQASSTGFTALDGLMMGERCGSIDPGVILHLIQQRGMTAGEVETLLYKHSGLRGVSGLSGDMRVLEESPEPAAQLAIDLFCHRAACEIAALLPAIGGLDALVFTAGIGENSARVRDGICTRLGWLGLALDPRRNAAGQGVISRADSPVTALVLPTNEELPIARALRCLLQAPQA